MKIASYTKTPQGDGFLFSVKPAPKMMGNLARHLILAFCGAVLSGGICIGLKLQSWTLQWLIPLVVFIYILVFLIRRDERPKTHRFPSAFVVYPNGIEVNGQKMHKDDIHRIIIRNAYSEHPVEQTTAEQAFQSMLANRSYSLNIESGGRATQLAGGMDEVTVHGLMTDVSHILEFS